jgi:hypothetical protein
VQCRAGRDAPHEGAAPAGATGDGRTTVIFDINDLFQWERFITPSIIKVFYWLAVAFAALSGFHGVVAGFNTMLASPFQGFVMILSSLAFILVSVIFARIAAEFVLIVFRINEHLGAIRGRGEM